MDPVLTVALTNSLALKLTSACHGSCSGLERLVAFGWTGLPADVSFVIVSHPEVSKSNKDFVPLYALHVHLHCKP